MIQSVAVNVVTESCIKRGPREVSFCQLPAWVQTLPREILLLCCSSHAYIGTCGVLSHVLLHLHLNLIGHIPRPQYKLKYKMHPTLTLWPRKSKVLFFNVNDLHSLPCYLSSSLRKSWNIQAWMGLKPWSLWSWCSALPVERSGQVEAGHFVGQR